MTLKDYPGVMENFEIIKDAAINDRLALMDCQDVRTNEMVPVVCAVNPGFDEETGEPEFVFLPVAMMFMDDPYKLVRPPMPGGGYHPTPDEELVV